MYVFASEARKISIFLPVNRLVVPGQTDFQENRVLKVYVGPATTQDLVVKFDGEISGGVLVGKCF